MLQDLDFIIDKARANVWLKAGIVLFVFGLLLGFLNVAVANDSSSKQPVLIEGDSVNGRHYLPMWTTEEVKGRAFLEEQIAAEALGKGFIVTFKEPAVFDLIQPLVDQKEKIEEKYEVSETTSGEIFLEEGQREVAPPARPIVFKKEIEALDVRINKIAKDHRTLLRGTQKQFQADLKKINALSPIILTTQSVVLLLA